MNIRNVLYPTDFSSCARGALGLAVELARAYGARLHLLHVVALPEDLAREPMFDLPPSAETYERLAREVDAALAPLVREAEAAGVSTVTAKRRGPGLGATILAYAHRNDVDLIVMGTHRRRGPARLLLGSLTEELVRYGHCSVLSVRGGSLHATVPRVLLVPFDFSPAYRQALAAAADLARRSNARLRLLHVVDEPAADRAADREVLLTGLHDRLQGELAGVAAGLDIDVDVRAGRVAAEIARASTDEGGDLVVMAGDPSESARRLLANGTAETVLRTATPPVLLIKVDERAAGREATGRAAAAVSTTSVVERRSVPTSR
jgi:nucleotide-binding universal stress UspA family protein